MLVGSSRSSAPKLSICITTFNRAAFIGETIESILAQLTDECEIVVVDGASTDDTQCVVKEYARRCERLRYFRQLQNSGFDRDCDRAVELANGEYCWLMADDDLLKSGAVAAVLGAIGSDVSLVVINAEVRDFGMSEVVQGRWIHLESDRLYPPEDTDRLFVEMGDGLTYAGSVVIKRGIWLARERERYYGSMFIFLGVIFQERLPGDARIIVDPLVSYRSGNTHTFSLAYFETYMLKFPALVWSLPLADWAKRKICDPERWRDARELFLWRARGSYSWREYRQWILPGRRVRDTLVPALIALLPAAGVNAWLVFYYSIFRRPYRGVWEPAIILQALRQSPFHVRNWRAFKWL